jgi:hypothetical protein
MTHEEAAESQVISGVVIFRSRPTNEVMTVILPAVMELIPIAIVAVSTKSTSCTVDLKTSGLPPCLIKVGEEAGSVSRSFKSNSSDIDMVGGDALQNP